ncbi:branched-chain amino acid aminotransferase [Intestinibacillus massiliensis]|uniref:branched-chain amino acid aminotransferase n=1 Tax=Intestinibacillus massiliensis TaxID=1871029 RepID=UPI000B356971|nr:branched-chain amino acid aminotransferase [Intestinibacillus massiliensis]
MLDIKYNLAKTHKEKPDQGKLGFGVYFTDNMFIIDHTEGIGWHDARIVPYAPLSIDPAAMVLHYAMESFEGMKAYRTPDGSIQLFRPDKNAERMINTNKRMCLPSLPVEDFVQAVQALVKAEADWVPSQEGTSLYIRPFVIATEPHLGVRPSKTHQFIIICSPVGAYYESGINPVKIFVEDEYTRACPGGTGFTKCGGNYAASLISQVKAHELGYEQTLWLDGVEHKYVEEVGSMNCFFKIGGTVYTAPCVGTVLPGVTRMSCIDLLRHWGIPVSEERLPIADIMKASREGKLEEVFGTGTAAVISPVGELRYEGEVAHINGGKIGEVTHKLYDTLTGIQWGKQPDELGWTVKVN